MQSLRLLFLLSAGGAAWAQSIGALSPIAVSAGSAGITLTVSGSAFNPCSRIRWEGVEQATTFVNTASLTAAIAPSLLVVPRAAPVTVINYTNTSAPCGTPLTPSAPVNFFVTALPLGWVTSAQLPAGTIGTPYSVSLATSGGVAPIQYTLAAGSSAPPGLTLASNGTLSGLPGQPGTFPFGVIATDSCTQQTPVCAPASVARTFSFTAAYPPLSITTSTLPAAVACAAYSATLAATGGAGGYSWSAAGLPQGLTISAQSGVISGSVAAAGSYQVTITVRDTANATAVAAFTIQAGAPTLAITNASLPGGRAGNAYSATLAATGGTAPYSFYAVSNAVPGLIVATSGAISGTPTQAGTFGSIYAVTDSASCQVTKTLPITVQPPALTITTPQAPQGYQGEPYGAQFQSSGGTGSQRTWSIATGALPAGLTLNTSTGLVSGAPTVAGSFPFDLRVSDGVEQATKSFTIAVTPRVTIVTDTLAPGSLCSPYSATIVASGGVPPYVWSATGLPTGLSINSQTGVISGSVTAAGTAQVVVSVGDQAKETPVQRTFTLVINASTLAISTATLPGGTIGVAYSATVTATGGIGQAAFSMTGGPPGLSISSQGLITGTPTQAGTFNAAITVVDGGCQVTRTIPIVIQSATPLTITTQQAPIGVQGESYGVQFQATGGSGTRTWSIFSGALPAGLTLNAATGTVAGTPTVTGTFPFDLRVTDSSGQDTKSFSIQVVAPLVITTAALPAGSGCATYSAQLAVSGGVAPFVWSATGLPAGLSINAQTGLISGTVSTSGTFTVVVSVVDQGKNVPTQKSFTLVLNASTLAIVTATLPTATPLAAYGAALAATGGVPPYTFALEANGVPGLTVDTNGNITGTPTQGGVFNPVFRVTDSAGCTTTRAIQIVVGQTLTITTVALPPARVNQLYSAQLAALGGTGQRTWTILFGALPSGLTLDPTSGVISGTPLAAGDFSIPFRVTDSAGITNDRTLTLTVAPPITITTDVLPTATQGRPYTAVVAATGGALPLRFASPDLPQGLVIDSAGNISGIPTGQGTFQVTIQVTDALSLTVSKLVTLNVNPDLRIVTDTLAAGQTGSAYNQTLVASGGLPPYTWSVVSPPDLPRGITLNAQSGQLLGTPSDAADVNVRFRVTDQTNTSVEKQIRLAVRSSFFIQTDTLAEAPVNEPYSATLVAVGGVGAVTWSTETNPLPAGLSLNAGTGVLSGTPTSAGPYTINVLAKDSAGNEARKTFSFVVRGILTIMPLTVPPGEMGVDYRQGITVTGTQTGVSLLLQTGSLPDGLRLEGLDRAANIIGTPTRTGTFVFTLRATDATGLVATRTYTVKVSDPLVISTAAFSRAGEGETFSFTLAATGGDAPYTWSLQSGSLPNGLQLDSATGGISGVPSQFGNFDLTLQVRDDLGRVKTRALALLVTPILRLSPGTVPGGMVGVPYSQTLQAGNASGPAAFTVTAGSLPPGLSLNQSTGALTGVPTQVGSFAFTVGVSDAAGARGQQAYSIATAVYVLPTVTVLPDMLPPAQQQPITAQLATAAATELQGTVRLTFVSADGGPADPAMRLNTADGRTATFRIPAGQTQAVFPASLMLQSGTVAGTITLTLEVTSNGVNVTPSPAPQRVIVIPAAAPVIDTVTARRSGNSITVEIVGYATNREVASAEFQFTAGSSVTQNNFTVQTAAVVRSWFQDARAAEFGSLFKLTMPFTISGDAAQITQVSVVLVNGTGRSAARQANVQ